MGSIIDTTVMLFHKSILLNSKFRYSDNYELCQQRRKRVHQ